MEQLESLRIEILKMTEKYAELLLLDKGFTPGVDPVPVSGKVLTSVSYTHLTLPTILRV